MKRTEILVPSDLIQYMSKLHKLPLEIDRATDRAYLRVGKAVFYATLPPVVARDAS